MVVRARVGERELAVYRELKEFGSRGDARFNGVFQDNLALGRPNEWSCRAGARYLYVDEHGIVHWCSQQRGVFTRPLADYTYDDLRAQFDTRKPCADTCTVGCVRTASRFDEWRPQRAEFVASATRPDVPRAKLRQRRE